MNREPTVRVQKLRRDTLKARLIVFGKLAILLLLASVFCEQLCPYDPYAQDLSISKIWKWIFYNQSETTFIIRKIHTRIRIRRY